MKKQIPDDTMSQKALSLYPRWLWLLIGAFVLIILVGLLRAPRQDKSVPAATEAETITADGPIAAPGVEGSHWVRSRSSSSSAAPQLAEEIVAAKVTQFGRNRRELVRSIARRIQKEIPPEVERFFDAIESGRWEDIEAQWTVLAKHSGQYEYSTNDWEHLNPFWMAVLDAYGVAEQAHLWPAQELLDYGNEVLGSLKPGMVYVGGTDNGRWVPELLNETSDDEQHIIVTQNAFADGRYLEFVNTLYDGRMTTLTSEDSKRAFQEYIADAQRRLEHDKQFPDEPKQVWPNEDIRVVDGKVQVSGQAPVMAINEKLLQSLMAKNPELTFAIQESFPLKGTYADALPLGPLMELRALDEQNPFTPERAGESLDYWRNRAQQILSDPEAAGSEAALKSYSHDIVSAANLLGAHSFNQEAEQAYQLAAQLWPENPEPIGNLADLLHRTGREAEAQQLLEEFARQHPKQQKDLERISAAWRATLSVKAGVP
jgi:hypothetical protein